MGRSSAVAVRIRRCPGPARGSGGPAEASRPRAKRHPPPLAQDRHRLRADGRVLVELKTVWRDGTSHFLFEPIEFLEKLAAIAACQSRCPRLSPLWRPAARPRHRPGPPRRAGHPRLPCPLRRPRAARPRPTRARRTPVARASVPLSTLPPTAGAAPRCPPLALEPVATQDHSGSQGDRAGHARLRTPRAGHYRVSRLATAGAGRAGRPPGYGRLRCCLEKVRKAPSVRLGVTAILTAADGGEPARMRHCGDPARTYRPTSAASLLCRLFLGGQCLSMAPYVTGTGAPRGAPAAGGC